jgi:hypothetical protein
VIVLSSGANTVNLTLAEKATLTNPYYAILFVNDNTGEKFLCLVTHTNVEDWIQQFTVTVQSNPNWMSGQVVLSKYGSYKYYAYEYTGVDGLPSYNTLITASTLVPTYFTTEVESGKMEFEAPTQTINTYINATVSVKAYGE